MNDVSNWIESLLEKLFQEEEWQHHFLVEVVIRDRKIQVFLDSESGITIQECQKVSRYLEHYLDEDQRVVPNYNLEVSSPGLDRPFRIYRQYQKNIGRKLDVVLTSGKKMEGELLSVDESGFRMAVPHPDKRRKESVEMPLKYDQIKQAKVKISFS